MGQSGKFLFVGGGGGGHLGLNNKRGCCVVMIFLK